MSAQFTPGPDFERFAEKALPQLEVLHSVLPKGEARSAVWRVILQGRELLASASGLAKARGGPPAQPENDQCQD